MDSYSTFERLVFNIKKITFESLANNDLDKIISNPFKINKIYPNPFNPITTIDFTIKKNDIYKIQILNMAGEEVNQIANREFEPGNYSLIWDGSNIYGNKVSSNLYFVKIFNEHGSLNEKVILLK